MIIMLKQINFAQYVTTTSKIIIAKTNKIQYNKIILITQPKNINYQDNNLSNPLKPPFAK